MAVYSEQKMYHTQAHIWMQDITSDFEIALIHSDLQNGIITGFTSGGVAALTILEYEPGLVKKDLKQALDIISPYLDPNGKVIPYAHHNTWHDDNGSSHIKAAILSPSVTIPFQNGKMVLGPWQNLTLIECDTRPREREVFFQVIGE